MLFLKFKQSKQLMQSHTSPSCCFTTVACNCKQLKTKVTSISLKDLGSNLNKTKNINKNTSFAEA